MTQSNFYVIEIQEESYSSFFYKHSYFIGEMLPIVNSRISEHHLGD